MQHEQGDLIALVLKSGRKSSGQIAKNNSRGGGRKKPDAEGIRLSTCNWLVSYD